MPFKLVNDASQFVAPIFINLLLNVVDNNETSGKGYFLAVLMFLGLMLGTICDNQHFQNTMRAGKCSCKAQIHVNNVSKRTLFTHGPNPGNISNCFCPR